MLKITRPHVLPVALAVILALVASVTVSAYAGSGARKAEELFEAGRFLEAASAFEAAYDKSRDAYFLYRAAKAMESSGDAAGAIRLYSRYMKTGLEDKERAEIESKIGLLRGRSSGHGRDPSACGKYVRCMRDMAAAYERSDFPSADTAAKGMRDAAKSMSSLTGAAAKGAASSCLSGIEAMSKAASAFKHIKGFVFPLSCRAAGSTASAVAESLAEFFGVMTYKAFSTENPGASCTPADRPAKKGRRDDGPWVDGGDCRESGLEFRGHPGTVLYSFAFPGAASTDAVLRRMRVGVTELPGSAPSVADDFEGMYGDPADRSTPKKGDHTYRWYRGGLTIDLVRWGRKVACNHTAVGELPATAPRGECVRYDVDIRGGTGAR